MTHLHLEQTALVCRNVSSKKPAVAPLPGTIFSPINTSSTMPSLRSTTKAAAQTVPSSAAISVRGPPTHENAQLELLQYDCRRKTLAASVAPGQATVYVDWFSHCGCIANEKDICKFHILFFMTLIP